MACNDVGSTNPDIAGLGVILSFTIQAGLSFCLSFWSVALQLRDPSGTEALTRGQLGQPQDESTTFGSANSPLNHVWSNLPSFYRSFIGRVWRNLPTPLPFLYSSGSKRLQPSQILDLRLKKGLIDQLLRTISDTQTINGISLLVGTIAQHSSLSLYHYHVVYDTVNFTGGSLIFVFLALYFAFVVLFGLKLQSWDDEKTGCCYKVDKISAQSTPHPHADHIYLAITALYLFVSLWFSLQAAREGLQGFIQAAQESEAVGHRSPRRNRAIQLLDFCLQVQPRLSQLRRPSPSPESPDRRHQRQMLDLFPVLEYSPSITVLTVALVQYPVHVYTLYALRASNESYLSGDSENQWGFGQVVALVLVASVLLECCRAAIEYRLLKWKRMHPDASDDDKNLLSLLRALLLDQEEMELALSEYPNLLRRRRSLPQDFKYQE
ncbi:hypothetical protein NUW58_g4350 [Xylaria curta]|uniref:Uncharacterized protein n=1 Tax=Xylaria curta TaxID=42375 RepID=A0ACC1P780_9PEZI|nr:hypothetical protein NUW58_g4350 [Xylaria curta]